MLAELGRLRESDVVRVLDLLVVHKDPDGVIQRLQRPELSTGAAEDVGAVVGALIGLGAAGTEGSDADGPPVGATRVQADGDPVPFEQEFWSLDDAIPNDSAAVIALVEHRWAIGTRDAIRAAGGVRVAGAWIHPADLLAAGLTDADDATLPDV